MGKTHRLAALLSAGAAPVSLNLGPAPAAVLMAGSAGNFDQDSGSLT
jgi:hypothetical protein